MKKLSKEKISEMAYEVMDFLIENELQNDVRIYFNNKCIYYKNKIVEIDDISPKDYFKYVAENHILSMSFEGALYEVLYDDMFYLTPFFNKYGLYDEMGNQWNLTLYPNTISENEIEYTIYK